MDLVLVFGKCYYKEKWNRQVTAVFNSRVSWTYTLSMKVKCVCSSGKTTAKKIQSEEGTSQKMSQIGKKKYTKTAMKVPPKISSWKSTSTWKSISASHLSGLEGYSSLNSKSGCSGLPFFWSTGDWLEPRKHHPDSRIHVSKCLLKFSTDRDLMTLAMSSIFLVQFLKHSMTLAIHHLAKFSLKFASHSHNSLWFAVCQKKSAEHLNDR